MAQESRYRSIQEHIRRMHPEQYLPNLPATEESFQLMINIPARQGKRTEDSTDIAALPNESENLRAPPLPGPELSKSRTSPRSLTPKVSSSLSSPTLHAGRRLQHSSLHSRKSREMKTGSLSEVPRNFKFEQMWSCRCGYDGSPQPVWNACCVMGCEHRQCYDCRTECAKITEGR